LRGIEDAYRHARETFGRKNVFIDIDEAAEALFATAGAGERVPFVAADEPPLQATVRDGPAADEEVEIGDVGGRYARGHSLVLSPDQ